MTALFNAKATDAGNGTGPEHAGERAVDGAAELANIMHGVGQAARSAARALATAPTETKNTALTAAAAALEQHTGRILDANQRDVAAAQSAGVAPAFIDRLTLSTDRINSISQGLATIAALPDPVGQALAEWDRPNGLTISRIRTPLGVIGIIYESRPNVTADAGALCLKSGNAAILRGGSDSRHTSQAIVACLHDGLRAADLPVESIQIVPTSDRAAVGMMLTGLDGAVDVIVPRGGKSLVKRVQDEARVPVFAHLEGNCHVYVDGGADLEEALPIIINSKLRRTGICGAAETVLIDRNGEDDLIVPIVKALLDAGCEVRGDGHVLTADPRVTPANEADWSTEYLDAIVAVKTVGGIDEAIDHIARYSSNHTEAILTECYGTAERFLTHVDSAIVLHNASTQFADGGEFGMGAEIGIATGKMHARGPVGLEQLTSFKYVVRGTGQIRPK